MKTYRDYMAEHANENLGWCAPLVDKTEKFWAVINETGILTIKTPKGDYNDPDAKMLRDFAKAVNPEYNEYEGWDDTDIAVDVMHTVGCAECPWNADCEEMDEMIGYEDDEDEDEEDEDDEDDDEDEDDEDEDNDDE